MKSLSIDALIGDIFNWWS